ncbi:septation protein SepH [Metallococcus carri]|nr:septation protein SepH [Metallococcus carri]
MRDLRFVGVSDDGGFVLLGDDEGADFRVPLNPALREALRPVRRSSGHATQAELPEQVRPRDVQALLRAGSTAEEVAERTGWRVDKVERFEFPIRAERDHVARTAQALPLQSRTGGRDTTTTVGERVTDRLTHRGVIAEEVSWDAWRTDAGWTVLCRFHAGGRDRSASWRFDAVSGALQPLDDESRWLSEDDQSAGPLPSAKAAPSTVYDVEAEGGLDRPVRVRRSRGGSRRPTAIPHATVTESDPQEEAAAEASTTAKVDQPAESEDAVDLVSVMRERSRNRRRGRRTGGREAAADAPPLGSHPRPEELEEAGEPVEEPAQVKPSVDELGHDPVTGTGDLFADLPGAAGDAEEADLEGVEVAVADADEVGAEDQPSDHDDHDDRHDDRQDDDADDEVAVPSRPSAARKGRPSVPSWDDIMFGRRG